MKLTAEPESEHFLEQPTNGHALPNGETKANNQTPLKINGINSTVYPFVGDLQKTELKSDNYNGQKCIYSNLPTIPDTLINGKSCKDDDCQTLNGGPRVMVGPHGGVLTRENTTIQGCANCSGGRLIRCARVNCTPLLCWGRNSKKPSYCVISVLAVIFLASFIGSVIFCFTNVFNNAVLSNRIIKNNSAAFEMWRNPPIHPLTKAYIFNYTNIDAYINGTDKKLRVEEVGPYVYSETINRVNVHFHPNGTLSFQEKKSYQFVANQSVGTQYDKVIVPNLPLLSAMSMVKESFYVTQMGLSAVLATMQTKAFREIPLHRFLWGYDDNLISLAQPFLKLKGDIPFEKFGLLVTRNGTLRDKITINTGEKDINKLGIINNINGKDRLKYWGTEECNRVDATDGTMFPTSMIDGKQPLYIFNNNLCRRYPFVFQKKVEVFNNIPAWRYVPPKDVFDDPSSNAANQCYCHIDSGVCPPKGVFNSSPCAFGAPAFASFPHFYLGDPNLLDTMDGLKPDPAKHTSFLDIHPGLGFPLAASSKMQINIQIRKSDGINGFDYLQDDMLLPIAWLDITVLELPQEIRTIIYHGTYSAHQIQLVLMWGFVLSLFISGLLLFFAMKSKYSKDSIRI